MARVAHAHLKLCHRSAIDGRTLKPAADMTWNQHAAPLPAKASHVPALSSYPGPSLTLSVHGLTAGGCRPGSGS